MTSPPSSTTSSGPLLPGKVTRVERAVPVFLQRLALPREHRRAGRGDRGGGVVLGREDVARGPAHVGADVLQRLDQHRGLDGHVQRAGHAHALRAAARRRASCGSTSGPASRARRCRVPCGPSRPGRCRRPCSRLSVEKVLATAFMANSGHVPCPARGRGRMGATGRRWSEGLAEPDSGRISPDLQRPSAGPAAILSLLRDERMNRRPHSTCSD